LGASAASRKQFLACSMHSFGSPSIETKLARNSVLYSIPLNLCLSTLHHDDSAKKSHPTRASGQDRTGDISATFWRFARQTKISSMTHQAHAYGCVADVLGAQGNFTAARRYAAGLNVARRAASTSAQSPIMRLCRATSQHAAPCNTFRTTDGLTSALPPRADISSVQIDVR
jgi:hypothetical protein